MEPVCPTLKNLTNPAGLEGVEKIRFRDESGIVRRMAVDKMAS